MKKYFPYKSDNQTKNIVSSLTIIKNYFGQASASEFTIHKDEARRQRYINRHKKNESKFWNKSGIDTASFWAHFYYGKSQLQMKVMKKSGNNLISKICIMNINSINITGINDLSEDVELLKSEFSTL